MKLTPAAAGRRITGRRRRGLGRWLLRLALLILLPVAAYAAWVGWSLFDLSQGIYRPQPTFPIVADDPDPGATQVVAAGEPTLAPEPPQPTSLPGQPTYTPRLPRTPVPTPTYDYALDLPSERINILLLGTDKRPELEQVAARSDTLIILSIDPDSKTAGILSIPRDLRVKLPGDYGYNKINAAYFFGEYYKHEGGGPALAVQTVQNFFKEPIDYYLTINFEGFEKVVDTVGGIRLYNPQEIVDTKYPGPYNSFQTVRFEQGCLTLSGERALQYARTRHTDSDFGRASRQQQVMLAVRDRALTLDMLPRYPELIGEFKDMIETSIPWDQQLALAHLATQIKREDIYTAQIDASMVTGEVAEDGSEDLVLDRQKAQPMLDWFFGRGKYAGLKPGATPTPTLAPPTATQPPSRARTATPSPRAATPSGSAATQPPRATGTLASLTPTPAACE